MAKGQSLVELALVLPCFSLGVLMAVQLICYCHNMIELQRMAQVMSDRLTCENYTNGRGYWRFNSLWGSFTTPRLRFSSERPAPWRPFRGLSTVQDEGRLFRTQVDLRLLPGEGFSRVLSTVSQWGFAETYLEPPVPAEQ